MRKAAGSDNPDQKPVFQTICTAKPLGDNQTPKTCVVHNLTNFLAALEQLPQNYNLNFTYVSNPLIWY